ncbi:MAG: hypothetical protein XE11_2335 [Methanomicrobiales archaeon 53_19]|nr:MAG: hypothetical protein XD88_2101 [Methanocalculus sp. 52_23]KUL00821.1 MAG: hypothetical protein XE11_2335 [Methanomicrobiales archaeon 53_19]
MKCAFQFVARGNEDRQAGEFIDFPPKNSYECQKAIFIAVKSPLKESNECTGYESTESNISFQHTGLGQMVLIL